MVYREEYTGIERNFQKKLALLALLLLMLLTQMKKPLYGLPLPLVPTKSIAILRGIRKTGKAGLGVVIRDHNGKLIDGVRRRFEGNSPLFGEALVVRDACLMAKFLGLRNIAVESDNKLLISLSVSELVPP